MRNGASRPLILGREYLATAGAVTDMPNTRISFVNIDQSVYYRAVPTDTFMRLASSVSVLVDKGPVKEVMNNTGCAMQKKSDTVAKGEVKYKGIKSDPHLMLIPHSYSGDVIEYEVKCKGTSKPFSKVRAILTSEMKEKGMEAVKGFMSNVLKLKMFDGGTYFGASSHAHPY